MDNFRIICPLMIMAFPGDDSSHWICDGPACAWYDAAGQCCCLLSIGRRLDKLQK